MHDFAQLKSLVREVRQAVVGVHDRDHDARRCGRKSVRRDHAQLHRLPDSPGKNVEAVRERIAPAFALLYPADGRGMDDSIQLGGTAWGVVWTRCGGAPLERAARAARTAAK